MIQITLVSKAYQNLGRYHKFHNSSCDGSAGFWNLLSFIANIRLPSTVSFPCDEVSGGFG